MGPYPIWTTEATHIDVEDESTLTHVHEHTNYELSGNQYEPRVNCDAN